MGIKDVDALALSATKRGCGVKVELIMIDGRPVGWTIKGETATGKEIVNTMRDLQFWGIDETKIVYDGRTEYSEDDAGKLHWIQTQHKKK